MTPYAYAHLENATLRIDVEREKKLQAPLHHLVGLVCFVKRHGLAIMVLTQRLSCQNIYFASPIPTSVKEDKCVPG